MQRGPKAAVLSPLAPAGEGGAQRRMREDFQLHREERPHLPSGHPLPLAGEETARSAAICQATRIRQQAAMHSLLPPAGEGGAQRRMRGAFQLHRGKRPHLPCGHSLPLAGEATAGSAAICQTTHSRQQAANLSLLLPAGEGGAQRRMRGAFQLHREDRPHLPCGHPLPLAGEETARRTAICESRKRQNPAMPQESP